MERKTLTKVVTGNVLLCCFALGISCDCLCRSKPTTVGAAPSRAPGQASDGRPGESWRFVVSGDSRNCGDVVMPAIAAGAKKDGAAFYWHLGDLRAIYDFDQDMKQIADLKRQPLKIIDYESLAWDDFIQNQIAPFGDMPFYLGIGNHEVIPPKSREQFVMQFADWLDAPILRSQRLRDHRKLTDDLQTQKREDGRKSNQNDRQLKTYYHWHQGVVDLIYLDNASNDQFDAEQLQWFNRILKNDADDPETRTIVVGMHKALPWSISCDHSMNESGEGERSGVKVYQALLGLQKKDKKVYVLASHSHYVMQDIFDDDHWKKNGGVLEGWIVGTGGAERYPLPLPPAADPKKSKTNVYGYLLGTVDTDGAIHFAFTEVRSRDIPPEVRKRYTESWVNEACFKGNRRPEPPPDKRSQEPDYCKEDVVKSQSDVGPQSGEPKDPE